MPIQFQYTATAHFGDDIKIEIRDNELYYALSVMHTGDPEWLPLIKLEVDRKKIVSFLNSLVSLKQCQDKIYAEGVLDGMSYTLMCSTNRIKKKIDGYFDMEREVEKCLNRMMKLHPDLKKPTENLW